MNKVALKKLKIKAIQREREGERERKVRKKLYKLFALLFNKRPQWNSQSSKSNKHKLFQNQNPMSNREASGRDD